MLALRMVRELPEATVQAVRVVLGAVAWPLTTSSAAPMIDSLAVGRGEGNHSPGSPCDDLQPSDIGFGDELPRNDVRLGRLLELGGLCHAERLKLRDFDLEIVQVVAHQSRVPKVEVVRGNFVGVFGRIGDAQNAVIRTGDAKLRRARFGLGGCGRLNLMFLTWHSG